MRERLVQVRGALLLLLGREPTAVAVRADRVSPHGGPARRRHQQQRPRLPQKSVSRIIPILFIHGKKIVRYLPCFYVEPFCIGLNDEPFRFEIIITNAEHRFSNLSFGFVAADRTFKVDPCRLFLAGNYKTYCSQKSIIYIFGIGLTSRSKIHVYFYFIGHIAKQKEGKP